MSPKFKSVSIKFDTYDIVGTLSKAITPGINLSFAKTIDYVVREKLENTLDRSNGKNNGTANAHTQEESSK